MLPDIEGMSPSPDAPGGVSSLRHGLVGRFKIAPLL